MTLTTVSHKRHHAKFNDDTWLTVSPFINFDNLVFGTDYELDVILDKDTQTWFVNEMKAKESSVK